MTPEHNKNLIAIAVEFARTFAVEFARTFADEKDEETRRITLTALAFACFEALAEGSDDTPEDVARSLALSFQLMDRG